MLQRSNSPAVGGRAPAPDAVEPTRMADGGSCAHRRAAHTIVISRLSWGAKMVFGMRAWTPRTMSTTWVTRKLTATLHSAYASSSLILAREARNLIALRAASVIA